MRRSFLNSPYIHAGRDYLFTFKLSLGRSYERVKVNRVLRELLATIDRFSSRGTLYAMPWAMFKSMWFYVRLPEADERLIKRVFQGADNKLRTLRDKGYIASYRPKIIGWKRVPEAEQHQMEAKRATFQACARYRLERGPDEKDDDAWKFAIALTGIALRSFCRTKSERRRAVRASFMRAAQAMRAGPGQATRILNTCATQFDLERARITTIFDAIRWKAPLTEFLCGFSDKDRTFLADAVLALQAQGRLFQKRKGTILRQRPLCLYQIIHPIFRVLNITFERELLLYGMMLSVLKEPLRLERRSWPPWLELSFALPDNDSYPRAMRSKPMRALRRNLLRDRSLRGFFFTTRHGRDIILTVAAKKRSELKRLQGKLEDSVARLDWPSWTGAPELQPYKGRMLGYWGGRKPLPLVTELLHQISAVQSEACHAASSSGRFLRERVVFSLLAFQILCQTLGLEPARIASFNQWWIERMYKLRKGRDRDLVEGQADKLFQAIGSSLRQISPAGVLQIDRLSDAVSPSMAATLSSFHARIKPVASRLATIPLRIYDDSRWGALCEDSLAVFTYRALGHTLFLNAGMYGSLEILSLRVLQKILQDAPGDGLRNAA